ncbi:MAG: glycosyltransferase [Chitinophagaceae bacterium]|nr:glycosyltransferase [Chitinophagaceae bacterium]
MKNKVLIGITSKNRVGILPQAIQSALNQSYPNKEVAVFDDCSTDGTLELANIIKGVSWHLSKEPRGYVFARNMFLQTTDAAYYVSLDDDSWFLNNNDLGKAVAYMDSNPSVAALAFTIHSPDDDVSLHKFDTQLKPSITNNFIGCGHMVRVEAVTQVGFYTPNPGDYGGEEKDLCIRLMDAGFNIITFPEVIIWHDKTKVARNLLKQHRSGVCNDLVFAYRRIPSLFLLPILGYKLFSHLKFSILFQKAPLVKPCLMGYVDFFKFLIKGNTSRKAVRISTYRMFKKLYN